MIAVASPRRVLSWAVPAVIALVILPFVVPPYQTVLLSYGLVFAIAFCLALVWAELAVGLFD